MPNATDRKPRLDSPLLPFQRSEIVAVSLGLPNTRAAGYSQSAAVFLQHTRLRCEIPGSVDGIYNKSPSFAVKFPANFIGQPENKSAPALPPAAVLASAYFQQQRMMNQKAIGQIYCFLAEFLPPDPVAHRIGIFRSPAAPRPPHRFW